MWMTLAISAVATAALGWWLGRTDRDRPWRWPVMAALVASTLWMVWALVSLAPSGTQLGMAPLPPKGSVEAAPSGFWHKLSRPGLTATRLCFLGLLASLVLAVWSPASTAGRLLRAVLASALLFFCGLWGLVLGVALWWDQGAQSSARRSEVVMTAMCFVLCCVALVRQGVPTTLPPGVPTGVRGRVRRQRAGRD